MRALKLGAVAALLVATVLGLLWITEAIPRGDVAEMAPKALGAIALLIVAGFGLSLIAGRGTAPDATDKRVP